MLPVIPKIPGKIEGTSEVPGGYMGRGDITRVFSPLSRDIPKFDTAVTPENSLNPRELYKNIEGTYGIIPKNGGCWEGEPGNSIWHPDGDYVPGKSNPEGNTWDDILKKYGIDGIPFKDGEPDFSEISDATVEIDDFSDSRAKNFAQADEKCAEQWNKEAKDGRTDWTSDDVAEYRSENKLTWHERSDMKTMDLVPSEVHNNIPHSGGISEAKNQNNNQGGVA